MLNYYISWSSCIITYMVLWYTIWYLMKMMFYNMMIWELQLLVNLNVILVYGCIVLAFLKFNVNERYITAMVIFQTVDWILQCSGKLNPCNKFLLKSAREDFFFYVQYPTFHMFWHVVWKYGCSFFMRIVLGSF